MFYVYVICSLSHPKRYYIGFTENIDQRVKEHNEGKSLHTAKYGRGSVQFIWQCHPKRKPSILNAILSQAQDGHFCSAIFFEEHAGLESSRESGQAGLPAVATFLFSMAP